MTKAREMPTRWDCHVHPFGAPEQYPVSPHATYAVPEQPFEAYRQALADAGIDRSVLVQPSLYGDDNAALIDRLRKDRELGHRAIIAPPVDCSAANIEMLHALGVRGVRLNLLSPGGNKPDSLWNLLHMMRSAGWHVAAHIDVTVPGLLDELVDTLKVPLVLDHMGRPPMDGITPDLAPFESMFRQMKKGNVYVKLSAPYQFSRQPQSYRDVEPLALGILRANPDRVLFGSNWPHIGAKDVGSVASLLATCRDWAELAGCNARWMLERNPLALYQ